MPPEAFSVHLFQFKSHTTLDWLIFLMKKAYIVVLVSFEHYQSGFKQQLQRISRTLLQTLEAPIARIQHIDNKNSQFYVIIQFMEVYIT